jgi:hypothetical protein
MIKQRRGSQRKLIDIIEGTKAMMVAMRRRLAVVDQKMRKY